MQRMGEIGKYAALFVLLFSVYSTRAARIVEVGADTKEHFFSFEDIDYLEDVSSKLSIREVSSPAFSSKFRPSKSIYPQNTQISSAYWYRIRVDFSNIEQSPYIFEFFNHTVKGLEAYIPDGRGRFIGYHVGANRRFNQRLFQHKNFQFEVPRYRNGTYTFYFRVKSGPAANVIIVLRSIKRFVGYALTEYLCFGLFYGMILIFSLYNLLMFMIMFERQYIYYILYLLSVAFYEMSSDGIAFQYLWPGHPQASSYVFGTPLFFISLFALLFTLDFLHVKTKARAFYYLIGVVILFRFVFYLICLFWRKDLFYYSAIEFIPLSVAFITGIYIYSQGYKPARFFVLGYSFLFIGFVMKALVRLDYWRSMAGPVPHYSMSLGFILEMVFLSFALGDKIIILRKKKELVQKRIIRQMEENAHLKDSMKRDLEVKVEERATEIMRQTVEIRDKSAIIARQNEELLTTNVLLKKQSEEIARMNQLLRKDNEVLQVDIQKVTHDRVMSAEMSFEEFSKIYPDQEACFRLLADLKWKNGYRCKKCGNENYYQGHLPYSRRCTRCRYEESVMAHTLLQNTRIPLNKAFYIIFLIYTSKGKISSYRLSELTGIRQSTCWIYSGKIKKAMDQRKRALEKSGKEGWSRLMVDQRFEV